MNTMQTNIENAINQNVDNIGGEDYDDTATYEEGDIVKYQGQLYICIEAIDTPEEWDSTKWSETDVLSSAGGNEVTIGTSADITSKTKIFIDESEGTDAYSEVVNSLAGDEIAKAPSVHAVNNALENTEIYSTDETRIGTWIDGKPLYRKVIIGTLGASGTTEKTEYNILPGTCKIHNISGNIYSSINDVRPLMVYLKTNDEYFISYLLPWNTNTNNYNLRWFYSSVYAEFNYEIIFEYTKTTDV